MLPIAIVPLCQMQNIRGERGIPRLSQAKAGPYHLPTTAVRADIEFLPLHGAQGATQERFPASNGVENAGRPRTDRYGHLMSLDAETRFG